MCFREKAVHECTAPALENDQLPYMVPSTPYAYRTVYVLNKICRYLLGSLTSYFILFPFFSCSLLKQVSIYIHCTYVGLNWRLQPFLCILIWVTYFKKCILKGDYCILYIRRGCCRAGRLNSMAVPTYVLSMYGTCTRILDAS